MAGVAEESGWFSLESIEVAFTLKLSQELGVEWYSDRCGTVTERKTKKVKNI